MLKRTWKAAPKVTNFDFEWINPSEHDRKLQLGTDYTWWLHVWLFTESLQCSHCSWCIVAFNRGIAHLKCNKGYLLVFARFCVPFELISDDTKDIINGKIINWLEIQGYKNEASPQYAPRSNGNAERAVHLVDEAMRTWKSNWRVSFNSFLQWILLTHRNTTNAHRIPMLVLSLKNPKDYQLL